MKIKEIHLAELRRLYENHASLLIQIGNILEPELPKIVDIFYAELLEIPEIAPIVKNALVQKNLKASQKRWIRDFFRPCKPEEIQAMIERQKKIGEIHANNNIDLNYFMYGVGLLKREIYLRIQGHFLNTQEFAVAFLVVGQLFDILVTIISEAYFLHEMVHETNEMSLKMHGMTQNTAIECERLRSLLLDWLRNTLIFLYQTPEIDIKNLPKLQYSNFGLWVIYKADLLAYNLNFTAELNKYIQETDNALLLAATSRIKHDDAVFFEKIHALNNAVSKTSWFITTIVDQAIEIDMGTDTLTRLFNRRYLDTILRRQTDIAVKQGLPYSVILFDIDHFKEVNDTYGHDSGDMVLKQFSELIQSSVRSSDFVFRYGGEEFLVVLSNVGRADALNIAEKIRHKCEEHLFRLPMNRTIRKTCSGGVSYYDGHPDFNKILKEADMALFEAKGQGRNQVCIRAKDK